MVSSDDDSLVVTQITTTKTVHKGSSKLFWLIPLKSSYREAITTVEKKKKKVTPNTDLIKVKKEDNAKDIATILPLWITLGFEAVKIWGKGGMEMFKKMNKK